ncbi:hypothetical protein BDW22DRAFT_1350016 [Trametopsis cervina]|nr:hypothetical protein BDW22DRAFT_1350016 [Trametopsis cervina]
MTLQSTPSSSLRVAVALVRCAYACLSMCWCVGVRRTDARDLLALSKLERRQLAKL